MSKLERNRQRITQRIDDKQYYEAQQQIRTLATRQIKAKDYDGAVDLLFTGSKALLEAGQGGSGADLALFLLEVFRMSERHCDGSSRALIIQLAGSYPQGDPLRRRFTLEAIRWSCDDAHPLGDAELHHFFGSLYIKDNEGFEAEKHLLLGTKESPTILAQFMFEWYKEDEIHKAPIYAARLVFGYLFYYRIRECKKALSTFMDLYTTRNSSVSHTTISESFPDTSIFPATPIFNYLSLLIIAAQKTSPELYNSLKKRYAIHLNDNVILKEGNVRIGELYFGVQTNKPRNIIQDLMGSLFSPSPANTEADSAKPQELD